MKRDLSQLMATDYDLIVVGGGIHGAFVAWDAALRGLSVALLEKEDFGCATSANSLRTIHGGLRYLQDGNLRLVRMMLRERASWLHLAPNLVQPLPFVIPTNQQGSRHKAILRLALAFTDVLARDQNRKLPDPLPKSRLISARQLAQLQGWSEPSVTGGALWYDAQVYDTERLTLAVVLSAAAAGAAVANHVEVKQFLGGHSDVHGVVINDRLSGKSHSVRARVVVNCAGAWADRVLARFTRRPIQSTFLPSVAVNLVTRRLHDGVAIGLPIRGRELDEAGRPTRHSRLLFVVPWHQFSLIGTWHLPATPPHLASDLSAKVVQTLIAEFNHAHPTARLTDRDIYHLHYGYLPVAPENQGRRPVRLQRTAMIHDHALKDGVGNLITVTGVKYTTAREAAARAVDMVLGKLGRSEPCATASTPLVGGDIENFGAWLETAVAGRPAGISETSMKRLAHLHGTCWPHILAYRKENETWAETVTRESPVLKAEVVHAARHEMACTLLDLVRRGLLTGVAGPPEAEALRACAQLIGEELGWSQAHREREVEAVENSYSPVAKDLLRSAARGA